MPRALEGVLRQVLEGPCAQVGVGKPLLLVIDDLERILDEPLLGSSQWRVQAAYHPMLRAVLRAFALARTDSRLLLTSRYLFTLPDGDRDLADRLSSAVATHGWGECPQASAACRDERACAYARAHSAATPGAADALRRGRPGNPGLQDLLTDLVLAAPEAAKQRWTR